MEHAKLEARAVTNTINGRNVFIGAKTIEDNFYGAAPLTRICKIFKQCMGQWI
ncbi:hypothetical protein D3C87_1165790 [compost metagenome]